MPMIPGLTPDIQEAAKALGLDYRATTEKLAAQGYVVLDRLSTGLTGATYAERKRSFEEFVRGLGPGVTELIVHLDVATPIDGDACVLLT